MNRILTVALMAVAAGFFCGPRAQGIAGSGGYDAPYFQADYIQDLSEFTSGIVNPALLYRVNQYHVDAGLYRWQVDGDFSTVALGYQEFSFLAPIRLNHTVGLSLIGTGAPIDKTTIDATDLSNTIKELGKANFTDMWIIGHYSWRLLPWFVAGVNAKVRLQDQFSDSSGWKSGYGLDLGFYFNPMDHYRFGDLGFSINFQDIVPTKLTWNGADSSELGVMRLRVGARYSGLNDRFVVDLEGVEDNAFAELYEGLMKPDKELPATITPDPSNPAKMDTTWALTKSTQLTKAFRMSAHFKWQFVPQIWLKAGWSNNAIPYVGFNFNIIYPLPEMINYLSYDFHIGYSLIENERGITLMNKLSSDFGPTREQRESKRMYDQLILAPMDAYNEAMRLYLAGKYWEAGFAFGKVISLYPNFYLNDKAAFYMGNSYKNLYMNETARSIYKSALEEYTTSEMRSKYLYGLESIDYREGKYEDALKNHAFITNLYAESDIRPDADYVAGQVHFLRKNYSAAEQLLSKVKPGSAVYLYAQYTLSIINVENKKIEAAVANLKTVIGDTTQDPGTQLLQDAANTKLGHVYYEQVELRNAVEAYKRVPEGSSYGDEAMLGTAWSWIKVNQPNMTLQTADRLISSHPESPLVPEAYLLKGYGLMLQKKFTDAVDALEKCVELAKGKFVTDADLKDRQGKFAVTVTEFTPEAEKIKKNALRKPTDKSIEERGPMKSEYDKFAKENRDMFNYQLLAQSHRRFFLRKEQLTQDAEYALAKATSMLKSVGQEKIIKKTNEEQEKINEEIEKKKKELEKLNRK
jgi:tetratricopeptide (TPR) repeat protein